MLRKKQGMTYCVHTGLSDCHCHLWRKKAGCQHARHPPGATNKQTVQEVPEESGRTRRSFVLRPWEKSAWSPRYRLQRKRERRYNYCSLIMFDSGLLTNFYLLVASFMGAG